MKLFYLTIAIGICFIDKTSALCEEDLKINEKFLWNIEHFDFSFEDENTKRFYFCLNYKDGLIDEKGLYIESAVMATKNESRQVQFREFLNLCNKESDQSKEDTYWTILKCMREQIETIDYPAALAEAQLECVKETGVPNKFLWKFFRLDLSEENESFKKYIFCVFKPLIDDEGKLTKSEPQFDKCMDDKILVDPESTWALMKCVANNFHLENS